LEHIVNRKMWYKITLGEMSTKGLPRIVISFA